MNEQTYPWYMVNKDGMCTLCADQADAEKEAKDAQEAWPHMGPHRAVRLVEVGDAGFTAADMATAEARGFREGQAAELAAMRAEGEPVAAPMVGEMALIAKALQRVGITNVLNHGAASCVFSQGCAGVSQGHLLAYTREIALQCAAALYTDPQPAAQDAEDAKRYRWLRRNAIGAFRTNDGKGPVSVYHLCKIPAIPGIPEETDAAIDAAIAAQQGDSHE